MNTKWLLAVCITAVTLLLVNRYTPLYINNDVVHYTLLVTAAYCLLMLLGRLMNRLKSRRAALLAFIAVACICFAKAFLTWGGEWKTQTIIYRNRENRLKTIEFQMRGDRFNFGYRKRVVGRMKILPTIDWITDIDTTGLNPAQWQRVDEQVNALGLKNYNPYGSAR